MSSAFDEDMTSMDLRIYLNDISMLLQKAIPHGCEIECEGPSTACINHELSCHIREAVTLIVLDVLSKGKACWCLNIAPGNGQERAFCFRPKTDAASGFKVVPMVIRSRDVGIREKCVRSLLRRLRHSGRVLCDVISSLEYDNDRRKIADRWGHALSWHISNPSTFTEPCFLLNECDSKLLSIKLCEAISKAMNETLSASGLSGYSIKIPTYSRRELELSRQKYIEGEIGSKEFSDLVLLRT